MVVAVWPRWQLLAKAKYVTLQSQYDFQPIAVETLHGLNQYVAHCFSVSFRSANFACERCQQRAGHSFTFCFSASQTRFSVLTRFFRTTVFLSSDHPD